MELNAHFYDEFKRQSLRLMPEQPVMLALVRLYIGLTFNDADTFSESQLRQALSAGEADAVTREHGTHYTPWSRHTNLIRELQHFWLLRRVGAGPAQYSFRPYAYAMCKRLHTTLFKKLVVSEVESAFLRLKETLGEGNASFLRWAREILPDLSLAVGQQLVALDNAIEGAVRQLRDQTGESELDFLAVLSDVDATLDDLLQKAGDLNRAFNHAAELEQLLTAIWTGNVDEDEAVNREAQEALRFIRRARQRLDELGQRLDWVRPRVQALFGNLTKLRFDHKTERFLQLLLTADVGKRMPEGVRSIRLLCQRFRFIRVPYAGQVLPTEPVATETRTVNPQSQEDFADRVIKQQQVRSRIHYWLQELRQALKSPGDVVRFSAFGQQILSTEGKDAYEILVQVLSHVRNEDELRHHWRLDVTPSEEELIENDFVRINLWKLTLTNP